MTKLTYAIIDPVKGVLKTKIPTYEEAKTEAKKFNALIKEEYTPIIEKYVRRSPLPISEDWIKRHSEN